MDSNIITAIYDFTLRSIAAPFADNPNVSIVELSPTYREIVVRGVDTERLVIGAAMGAEESSWGISYEVTPDDTTIPVMITNDGQEIRDIHTLDHGEHILETVIDTIRVFLENGSVVWARSIPAHPHLYELESGATRRADVEWDRAAHAALDLFATSGFDHPVQFDGEAILLDDGNGFVFRISVIEMLGWDVLVDDDPLMGGLVHYASDEPITFEDFRVEGVREYAIGRVYALLHEYASRSRDSFVKYVSDPSTSFSKTY